MSKPWVPIGDVTDEMVAENLRQMESEGVTFVRIAVCNMPRRVYAYPTIGTVCPRPVVMREWNLLHDGEHTAYSNGWMPVSRALYADCVARGWLVGGDRLGHDE